MRAPSQLSCSHTPTLARTPRLGVGASTHSNGAGPSPECQSRPHRRLARSIVCGRRRQRRRVSFLPSSWAFEGKPIPCKGIGLFQVHAMGPRLSPGREPDSPGNRPNRRRQARRSTHESALQQRLDGKRTSDQMVGGSTLSGRASSCVICVGKKNQVPEGHAEDLGWSVGPTARGFRSGRGRRVGTGTLVQTQRRVGGDSLRLPGRAPHHSRPAGHPDHEKTKRHRRFNGSQPEELNFVQAVQRIARMYERAARVQTQGCEAEVAVSIHVKQQGQYGQRGDTHHPGRKRGEQSATDRVGSDQWGTNGSGDHCRRDDRANRSRPAT